MPLSRLFQAHMRELLSLEDAAIARVLAPYRQAHAELTQRLLELDGLGRGETFSAQRLALMRAQLATVLAVTEGRQQEELRQALQEALVTGGAQQVAELAELEARFGSLATSELVGLIQPIIPAAASAALADASTLLISRFRNEVQYNVSQALAQSVVQGEGIAQAARRLGRTMDGEQWRLERIARTEIGNAMNAGHQATIEQVAAQFPEMGLQKQWSAHLDSRTSARCRGLHLQVRETTQLFTARDGWQGMNPPAHPNCRSRVVAYSPRWERTGSQKIAEQGAGTARNPVSSSVPASGDVVSTARSNSVRGVPSTVRQGQPQGVDELRLEPGVHFGAYNAEKAVNTAQRRAVLGTQTPLKLEGFLQRFPLGDIVFTDAFPGDDAGGMRGLYLHRSADIILLGKWPRGSFGRSYEKGVTQIVAELAQDQAEAASRAFIHELAHHIHTILGPEVNGMIVRTRDEVAGNAITKRAMVSEREYFAETMTAYRFEPDLLQARDKKGYKLVERVLKKARERGASL